jgi:basic membrane protein A
MEAYKLGAESVNPDIKVTTVYVGSFEDVSKAKEATLAQASVGVDVVFHVADAAGIGVVQACEEAGIMAIGWGVDQNYLAPETVITSMLFDNIKLLIDDMQLVVDGKWTGETRLYGIDSGVVGLADYHGLVPDDVAAEVEAVKEQIISGELQVPYITESSQ